MTCDEAAGLGDVAAGRRVMDGLGDEAPRPVPGAGAAVKARGQLWLGPRELVAEQLGEEVVVAIPLPLRVEREQEQAQPLELVEASRRVLGARDRVAERSAKTLEDRGPQQEVADGVGLTVEHLEAEVIDDRAVVAGERRDEGVRVGVA